MSHEATNWAIKQRGLKPTAKIVLWHLCDRYHPDNGCFPSQETLADDCEMSRSALNSWLAILEHSGRIRRETRRDPETKRQQSTHYRFPFEKDWPGPISGAEPCPEPGHGAESGSAAEPCPENDQSRVRNPDTNLVREPVREPERERAREDERPEAEAKGLTVNQAWVLILKAWPDIALESEMMARSALTGMSPEDRKLAVERIPAFIAYHQAKRGKAKLPFLHNYLNERSRWTTLPGEKSASVGTVERKTIEAFSRAWWWLFFDSVKRLGTALLDQRSAESVSLRDRVTLARQGIGWPVGASRLEEIILAGKAFVQIPVDGKEFTDWTAALRKAGVDLPRPDKAGWIFVPSQWPPDERERDEALREAAETVMGAER